MDKHRGKIILLCSDILCYMFDRRMPRSSSAVWLISDVTDVFMTV